jgi:hypothetical protein
MSRRNEIENYGALVEGVPEGAPIPGCVYWNPQVKEFQLVAALFPISDTAWKFRVQSARFRDEGYNDDTPIVLELHSFPEMRGVLQLPDFLLSEE